MFAMCYVSAGSAPATLTIVMPLVLLVGDLVIFNWFVIPRSSTRSSYRRAVVNRLHTSVWGTMFLGASHVIWAISLIEHGTEITQGLIITIIGVSAFGAALCLMHLRAAAFAMSVSTAGPLIVFLWVADLPGHTAISLILALISGVFVFVANRYGEDFALMTMQRLEVEAKKTEAEQVNRINTALANQDSLTGLANRRAFLTALNVQVSNEEVARKDGPAVGILDLDGFKLVNDVYGHLVGDRLLKLVSQRLKELFRGQELIARLGGDEFGIITSGKLRDDELLTLGGRICDAMRIPFDLEGLSIHLGGSVGFAKWINSKDTAELIFERADYALYHAKKRSRGGVILFNERHAAEIREISGVDRQMREADFESEMSLAFQPIVVGEQGTTTGFEALARWHSPILGTVPPDVFIPSAERAGTIERLTSVLLEKALNEVKNWPEHLFVSFNLSMQDISSSEAVLRLVSIVQRSGIDPKRITFEITETAVMHDYERVTDSLKLLKNMGSKIALDDFGTGYSSLSYVRALPLDKLKLDRSFIAEIKGDKGSRAVVQAVVDMCESLNLECIVEGVETRDQLEVLDALGVKLIQGYCFSRPLRSQEVRAYINDEYKVDRLANIQ